jgi:competence protein ComEC
MCVLGIIIAAGFSLDYKGARSTEIAFLDVGQGDATLITDSTGYQLLIDAGRDRRVLYQLEKTMPIFDRTLDMLIATHPDADHIGGFESILEKYNVDLIIDNNVQKDTPEAGAYRGIAREKGLPTTNLFAGDEIITPGRVVIRVLSPEKSYRGEEINNHSIVLMVEFNGHKILLTGDIDSSVELDLVEKYSKHIRSDILKIAHHGSKTSSGGLFLDAVDPRLAIATYGCENDYGHPHKSVVYRYQIRHIPVVTTCDRKTMVIDLDKSDIQIAPAGYRLF